MPTFQSAWQNHYRVDVEGVLVEQDVAGNRSRIAVRTWVNSEPGWPFQAYVRADVSVNGQPYGWNNTFRNLAGGSAILVAEHTLWVDHNSDGTKTVTIGGYAHNTVMNFNIMTGGQWVLPTIARATTPQISGGGGGGGFTTGVASTISLPRAVSSFTHDVTYHVGSQSGTIATGAGVSTSWTPPHTLMTEYPGAATGQVKIKVVTKNGTTTIGTREVNFSLTAGSAVVPTVSSVLWDDTNTVVKTNIGGFVQGLSQIKGQITATGVHGSSIASKRLIVDGTQRAENVAFQVDKTGTITATGEATDTRGRVGTKAANLTILPYTAPTITALSVIRTNNLGVAQDDGEYLRVILTATVQSLIVGTQKNSMTIKVKTRPEGGGWTNRNTVTAALSYDSGFAVSGGAAFPASQVFDVQVTVEDKTGQLAYRDVTVAQGGVPIVHFDGQKTAFNKYGPRGTVDVGGDAYATNMRADENVFAGGAILAPVGSMLDWPTATAPTGWLLCQGQAVSRTTYAALFALIGTTFGAGNGSSTFNLPDLRGRVSVGLSSTDTEFNELGKQFGTKTHTLTVAEMPSHDHGVRRVNGFTGGGTWNANDQGASSGGSFAYTQKTGGGGAHNNIQPSIALNKIIRAL